jgi:hypothetical protein
MTVGVFIDFTWTLSFAGVATQLSEDFAVEATWMYLRRFLWGDKFQFK